jgi:predicted nucleotidyltransferase
MRALFPLLVKMIRHEQMHNGQLEINVRDKEEKVIRVMTLETLAKKKKNRRKRDAEKLVWLLGDYVYDTAKKLQVANITERMWHVLQCFLPESQICNLMDNKSSSDSWATLLPQILQEQKTRRITPSPDSLFVTERKEQVQSIAEMCDETYLHIFHHENAEAQHARGLYQQAVDRLVGTLRSILQRRYKGAEVIVYGSCLSNLSLGKSSDVDISLHLPAAAHLKEQFASGKIEAEMYEREMKRHVHKINSLLTNQYQKGFQMQECVTRARVPVIKGTYLFAGNPYSPDGSIE